MKEIIGRNREQEILQMCYDSSSSEFVALYGRRRVGKTFLVKKVFENKITFYATGIYEGTMQEQLTHFWRQLIAANNTAFPMPKDWFEAFEQLKVLISNTKKKRVVVFLDELPWFDSHKSRFIKALELFWNSWGADQDKLMLVICGSSTTWMKSKIIYDKGGLHNRLTRSIYLAPFTIAETAEYLRAKNIDWTPKQIAECYMVMGGIPYYLNYLHKSKTLNTSINELYFKRGGELREEFNVLFRSLFSDSSIYRSVIELLSKEPEGLTTKEIAQKLKINDGGSFSKVLENLCDCDFIAKYYAYGRQKREHTYKVVDFFSLFYMKFVNIGTLNSWTASDDDPYCKSWDASAFELLCYYHIDIIKQALGISGVITTVSSWRHNGDDGKAQIDLVIDRHDDIINLCEIKFHKVPFAISEDYSNRLEERKELFRTVTKTRKSLRNTMITLNGLKMGKFNDCISDEIDFSKVMGLR